MKPNNSAYLLHIRDAIKEIVNYSKNATKKRFLKSPWDQAAVIRYLEIIGEAASNISNDYKKLNSEIPWRKISGFRNVLVHEYFGVDLNLVWQIIKEDIPELKENINKLVNK